MRFRQSNGYKLSIEAIELEATKWDQRIFLDSGWKWTWSVSREDLPPENPLLGLFLKFNSKPIDIFNLQTQAVFRKELKRFLGLKGKTCVQLLYVIAAADRDRTMRAFRSQLDLLLGLKSEVQKGFLFVRRKSIKAELSNIISWNPHLLKMFALIPRILHTIGRFNVKVCTVFRLKFIEHRRRSLLAVV